MIPDSAWRRIFDELVVTSLDRTLHPARLSSEGGNTEVPGKPGWVYINMGTNGERGPTMAYDAIGIDTAVDNQQVWVRREKDQLIIREADYLAAGGGGGSGSTTLVGLSDTVFTGLADGDILMYDSATGNWVNATPEGETGGAPSPHALNSAHHSGVLDDSQGPNFLLRDGSRSITGNLSVSANIMIDGVDLNNPTDGIEVVGIPGRYRVKRSANSGLEFSSGALQINTGSNTVLTGGELLVNQAATFIWTAQHQFNVDPQISANLDFIGGNRSITGSGDVTLAPVGDLVLSAGGIVQVNDDQEIRTISIQDLPTGIKGVRLWERDDAVNYWQLTMGAARFDELYARVFVADETRVDRGEEYWSKSYGLVETDFTIPAIGATVDVWFEDAPGLGNANLFSVGDWLLFRVINWGTGIVIAKFWMQVTSAGVNGYVSKDATNKRQQWRLTHKKFGTAGMLIKKGSLGLDAGQVGQGWIHLSALSQGGGPFIQIGIFTSIVADEPQFTPYTRMGNLSGTVDYTSSAYGFVTGTDITIEPESGFSGMTSDSVTGIRLFNTDMHLYDAAVRSLSIVRSYGIALLNDTATFANNERNVAWYDNLEPVGTATAKIGSWGTSTDRRLHLTSFGADRAAIFVSSDGDGGADSASIAVKAGGWNTVLGGLVQLSAVYITHIASGANPRFRIGGDASSLATSNLHVYDNSTATDLTTGIIVEQDGGGDATLHWVRTGFTAFTSGIDATDGNWKLSSGNTVHGAPFIILNPTTGKVIINGLDLSGGTPITGLVAGTGIDISGSTIAVDPTQVVLTSRNVSTPANSGLSGGGNLGADLALTVDSTVVRTTRTITVTDGLSGGGNLGANLTINLALAATDSGLVKVGGLAINEGNGLQIASNLLTLKLDNTILTSGSGLTVGANGLKIALLATVPGLAFSGGALYVDAYHGITRDANGISIARKTASGLVLDAAGLAVGAGDGISVVGTTVAVIAADIIDPTKGLTVTSNNIQIELHTPDSGMAFNATTGGLAMGTPGTLTVSTGNAVSGSGHFHAITASSNVGATPATALLKSDTSGNLTLAALTLYGNLVFNGVRTVSTNSTNGLTLAPGGHLYLGAVGDLLRSTVAFSDLPTGIQGFRLWDTVDSVTNAKTGNIALATNTIRVSNMYARAFVADLIRVDLGSEYWSKSSGIVESDFNMPALGGVVDVYFEDNAKTTIPGATIFSVNDWLLFQIIDMSSGLIIAQFYMKATVLRTPPTPTPGKQWWRLQYMHGDVPQGTTIRAGAIAVDIGQVGQGWVHISGLSDSGNDGPFVQVGNWTGILPNGTVTNTPMGTFVNRVRMGNLKGTVDYGGTNAWGFAAGNNLGQTPELGFSGLTADATNGLRMFNTDIILYEGGVKTGFLGDAEGLRFLLDNTYIGGTRSITWRTSIPDGSVLGSLNVARVLTGAHTGTFQVRVYDVGHSSRLILQADQTGSLPYQNAYIQLESQDPTSTTRSLATIYAGKISFTSALTPLVVSGDLAVTSDLTVAATLDVNGQTTLAGLSVAGAASFSSTITASTAILVTGYVSATTDFRAPLVRALNSTGLRLQDDGGNGMMIGDGGFVGIGNFDTASPPGFALHVRENGTFNGQSGTYIVAENDASTAWGAVGAINNNNEVIQIASWGTGWAGSTLFGESRAGKGTLYWSGGQDFMIGTSTGTANLLFATGNARRMTIKPTGQVEIGAYLVTPLEVSSYLTVRISSANPVYASIENTSTGQAGLVFRRTGGVVSRWIPYIPGGVDQLRFYSGTQAQDMMTLSNNGFVGIGTSKPGIDITTGASATGYDYPATGDYVGLHIGGANPRLTIAGVNDAAIDLIDQDAAANNRWMQFVTNGASPGQTFTRFRSMQDAGIPFVDNILVLNHSVGSIGLRVATPGAWMDMHIPGIAPGSGGLLGYRATVEGNVGSPHFVGRRANIGTGGALESVKDGHSLMTLAGYGYKETGGWSDIPVAQVVFAAKQSFTGTAQGAQVEIYTTGIGTTTPRLTTAFTTSGKIQNLFTNGGVIGTGALTMRVDNLGFFGTTSSSIRYKHDVRDLPQSYISSAFDLRPVLYKGKDQGLDGPDYLGFIAEEVDQLDLPGLVTYNEDGVHGLEYDRTVVLLIGMVQYLKSRIDQLEAKWGTA